MTRFTVATFSGKLSGMETTEQVAARLTILRSNRQPKEGFERIAARLLASSGVEVSGETLRAMHNGSTKVSPDHLDLEVIVALADYYGVKVSSISRVAAERIARLVPYGEANGALTDRWAPGQHQLAMAV